MFGLQAREDRKEGIQLRGKIVHQVACEDNEVGCKAIDDFYGSFHGSGIRTPTAGMDVGYLHDAVSFEALWDVFGVNFHFLDLEMLLALRRTEKDEATREEPDGQCDVALVELMVYLSRQASEGQRTEGKERFRHVHAQKHDEQ